MTPLTADQAAFLRHTLGAPALRAEHAMTTAVIAAIPPGLADYRPHRDSRSAFDLALAHRRAEIKYLNAIASGASVMS